MAKTPLVVSAVVVAAIIIVPISGDTLGARFLATLRIARPKSVVAAPAATSAAAGRQLQTVVAGMLADTTDVSMEQTQTPIATPDSASRAAGFAVALLGARDSARIKLASGRSQDVRVNRDQLQTLFKEAGRPANVPAAVNGASVSMSRPRGVRIEYGHCPQPIANTLQNQIQGPPPPSTDNGNCVILTETPVSALSAPAGLDTAAVMEIALELMGMSPNQARDFRAIFDWPSALSLSLPRFVRSYQTVSVAGAPGMLIIGAGRREPAYTLLWKRGEIVYSLAGYGSSGDALPMAAIIQ